LNFERGLVGYDALYSRSNSGCYSSPCHLSRGGPASIPVQSTWEWWWTKWHWGRFISEQFGFLLPASFQKYSHFIHI